MKAPVDYSLYLVTDRGLAGARDLGGIIREAVSGGVTLIQLREKNITTGQFLREAMAVKNVTDSLNIPLIINDRLDIALACNAAGVHLGQDDMNCRFARRIGGTDMIIGVSVSTVNEACEAVADGADYLGISPVFSTPTKTDTPPATGLDGIRRIREVVSVPLIAIGGIDTENTRDVIIAGADGIAVVSAIMGSPDPCSAAHRLYSAAAESLRHTKERKERFFMDDKKSKEELYEEARQMHHTLDEKLIALEQKPYLTGDEEIEIKQLKKQKLYYKDEMERLKMEMASP